MARIECHRWSEQVTGPFIQPAVPMEAVYETTYENGEKETERQPVHAFGYVREILVHNSRAVEKCPRCGEHDNHDGHTAPLVYNEEYGQLTTVHEYVRDVANMRLVEVRERRAA